MAPQLKELLEKGAGIALDRYRRRHPILAEYLHERGLDIIWTAVQIIQHDGELMAALASCDVQTRLQRTIEIVSRYLPKAIETVQVECREEDDDVWLRELAGDDAVLREIYRGENIGDPGLRQGEQECSED